MKKNMWVEPKLTNLSVDKTEHGGPITNKVDSHIKVGKDDYYSFS